MGDWRNVRWYTKWILGILGRFQQCSCIGQSLGTFHIRTFNWYVSLQTTSTATSHAIYKLDALSFSRLHTAHTKLCQLVDIARYRDYHRLLSLLLYMQYIWNCFSEKYSTFWYKGNAYNRGPAIDDGARRSKYFFYEYRELLFGWPCNRWSFRKFIPVYPIYQFFSGNIQKALQTTRVHCTYLLIFCNEGYTDITLYSDRVKVTWIDAMINMRNIGYNRAYSVFDMV